MGNGKPSGVMLVGTCSKCNEAVELPFSRQEAKKLRKMFKGITRPQETFATHVKCNKCGAELDFTMNKREAKIIWEGMEQPTIRQANEEGDKIWLRAKSK